MSNLIYVPVDKLRLHPKNIRRYYPAEDVQEMADSIKTVGGVIQALQVVPNGSDGSYYVVDGNMRLAAARTIEECPPLKCEVLNSNQAEQLLIMLTTSHFHYPKDKISLALHYKRLQDQEALTVSEIAEAVGMSTSSIHNTMKLLEMDPPIQDLISQGKLTPDYTAMRQLRRVPEAKTRIRLARRFALNGTSAKSMQKSITHVLRQYEAMDDKPDPKPTIKRTSKRKVSGDTSPERLNKLADIHICPDCRLDGLDQQCYTCAGPYEFINALIDILPVEKIEPTLAEELPQ